MSKRALLLQTFIATALWAVGMTVLFAKPAAELLPAGIIFACVYWVIARLIGHFVEKRKSQ